MPTSSKSAQERPWFAEPVTFRVAPGVVGLMQASGSKPCRIPVFSIQGDLAQMAAQKAFLQARGFEVGQSDVYPVLFDDNDVAKALKLIWERRVSGWWHYDMEFEKRGICDKREFDIALNAEVERKQTS